MSGGSMRSSVLISAPVEEHRARPCHVPVLLTRTQIDVRAAPGHIEQATPLECRGGARDQAVPLVTLFRERSREQAARAAQQGRKRARARLLDRLAERQIEHVVGATLDFEHYALVGILPIGILARRIGTDRESRFALARE